MTSCVACEKHCSGIALDRERGIVPRAFAFGTGAQKQLAVIFGEPGAGSDLERELFAQKRMDAELLYAVEELTFRCFHDGNYAGRPNPFHKRITGLLVEAFGSTDAAMAACYFSNLTKCEKAANKIPWSTRVTCFDAYLANEIRLLHPQAALLLGGNAGAFAQQVARLGPRVIVAAHPSARPPAWLGGAARTNLIQAIRDATGVA